MNRDSMPQNLFKVSVLAALAAAASASTPAVECGVVFEGTDIPGGSIPGSEVVGPDGTLFLDTLQDCVDLCEATPGCTAATRWATTGRCFLKNDAFDTITLQPRTAWSTFILCPDEMMGGSVEEPEDPTPGPTPEVTCGTPLVGIDFVGPPLGVAESTASNEACQALCDANPDCNSWVRQNNGNINLCFIRNVDLATVETFADDKFTSFFACP